MHDPPAFKHEVLGFKSIHTESIVSEVSYAVIGANLQYTKPVPTKDEVVTLQIL